MAQLIADRADLDFVIWEQMNGEELLQSNAYKEFNKKTLRHDSDGGSETCNQ